MPDATITSTASTFGTISGVFSADQSTITGTVSGIIPGTLTGSVGVPGPAGPAGQGVPAGGTAGQYLQKIDGTNYNTDWVTLNLGNYALLSGADFTGRVSVPSITGDEVVVIPGFNIVPTQTEPTDKVDGDLWVYDDEGLTPSKFRVFLESETQNIATESWVTTSFAPKASPVFTGDPRAPTPASGDNDTSIATTAFVKVQGYITSAALTPYLTSATAASTYQTLAGMSSYLTTSAAASTYAVIAAGQPVAGSTGQVLTKNSGTNYDSSWQTLIPGDRYLTTSTTSNTVSNGNKTFTIGTGLSYTPTQNITISYDASNHMHGEVLTYNSGTGVLTVDVNHHTGSGTYASWVVNVGGVTPATSVAWGAITGTLSTQTDLQSALDLKSNLASPTFTGTPTLPTGTIATTQSPGNNTTALATTAFVTAAVPAFATTAQVVAATSTTTALAAGNQGFLLTNPRLQTLAFFNQSSVSGSGALSTSNPQGFSRQVYLSTLAVGRSAYLFGVIGTANGGFGTSTAKADQVDFSKKVWIGGYAMMGHGGATSYLGDANTMCRISLGGYSTQTTGNMTLKGIGLKKVGGAASTVSLTVHNGTTLTDVASSVTVPDGGGIHWQIYSDGTGNVTLYINGTQAATTTAGPTTATASGQGCYREQVEAVATPGVRQVMNCNGGWFYTE
jgi:hypothetical protein